MYTCTMNMPAVVHVSAWYMYFLCNNPDKQTYTKVDKINIILFKFLAKSSCMHSTDFHCDAGYKLHDLRHGISATS